MIVEARHRTYSTLAHERRVGEAVEPAIPESAAFARAPVSAAGATVRRGNIGHNALRGPSYQNIDLSVPKNIPFRAERGNFEIRADFLNAFNHTNYTSVETQINRGNFCQVLATTGVRTIQLQARISF